MCHHPRLRGVAMTISVCACSNDQEQTEQRSALRQVVSVCDVGMRRLGLALLVWLLSGVTSWAAETALAKDSLDGVPYFVATPASTSDNQRLGLFLVFHGKGGKAEPLVNHVIRMLGDYGLKEQFVVVGVQNDRKPLWALWPEPAIEVVTRITEKVLVANPSIDRRRVYTYGQSAGAWMAGAFAAARPRVVAAALPYGMGIGDEYVGADKSAPTPPMYMAIGSEDPHCEYADPSAAILRKARVPFVYRYMPGLGHSFQHKGINEDSFRWAVMQRNELIAPSTEELARLRAVAKPTAQAPLTSAAIASAGDVGGSITGATLLPLLTNKDPTLVIATITTIGRTWCGSDAVTAVARKLKDKAPEVRAAAIATLGIYANWRMPIAQEALAAAFKSAAPEDRILALSAAQAALRWQADPKANPQDPGLFQAVVAALSDEDVQVRTAALAALAPAKGPEFDPAGDAALRRKQLAAWQQWAAALMPKEMRKP